MLLWQHVSETLTFSILSQLIIMVCICGYVAVGFSVPMAPGSEFRSVYQRNSTLEVCFDALYWCCIVVHPCDACIIEW